MTNALIPVPDNMANSSRGEGLRAITLLTLTGLSLVTVRGCVTGNWWFFVMLTWNLALAWFPLGIVLVLRDLSESRLAGRWITISALVLWLAFLPNAPYIITDLFHIQELSEPLLWFDTLTLFVFALTGLLLGLYSTLLVHRLLKPMIGKPVSWGFILFCQGLSGFGIYLGRYGRLNSWHLLTHPFRLLKAISDALRDPTALKMTFTYGFGLACLYVAFYLYADGLTTKRERA